MAAIAGMMGKNGGKRNNVPSLLNKMKHRGPEKEIVFSKQNVCIGHRSMNHPVAGNLEEAYANKDRSIYMVCDGEIGQMCSEKKRTLLDLYEKEGVGFVKKLEGPFAFLVADYRSAEPVLVAARDYLGAKPLYYVKGEGQLIFSSEMKSLTDFKREVHPFPPGYYYHSENGFVEFDEVVPMKDKIKAKQENMEKVMQTIRSYLTEAVELSLDGPKEVGLMLSGGLDSSLVAGIVREISPLPRKSFCVGAQGSQDIVAAREVAEALGTEHYEYEYRLEEMIEALPRVIYYLESFEPSLVRSAIPNYFAFQMASKHVDLVLSGEGADELFSGYDYLKDFEDPQELDEELIRVINSLHHIGLQRGDRMSAANGIEVRTPFLDRELMEYALKIPVDWKLKQEKNGVVEKWILRKAFHGMNQVPEEIIWRDKQEFSEGSGAKDCIRDFMEDSISDEALKKRQEAIIEEDGIQIRSKEELYYYEIFKRFYPDPRLAKQVGRWETC